MTFARCGRVSTRRSSSPTHDFVLGALRLLFVALLLLPPRAASAEGLEAGFGSAPLPIPDGGPLGGYGGLRDRRAEGLLDPPEARALVVERRGLRVGIVVVDLVISRPALRDALLEQAVSMDGRRCEGRDFRRERDSGSRCSVDCRSRSTATQALSNPTNVSGFTPQTSSTPPPKDKGNHRTARAVS